MCNKITNLDAFDIGMFAGIGLIALIVLCAFTSGAIDDRNIRLMVEAGAPPLQAACAITRREVICAHASHESKSVEVAK